MSCRRRPAWAASPLLAAVALLSRGRAATERGAVDPQEGNWWLHLDILVSNLDCSGLDASQRHRSSGAVAGALVALCGVDLHVMSLEAAADTVSVGAAAACSWSPSHWQHAVRSEQFQTMLASIFEAEALEVADVALVPLTPEDDDCGGGGALEASGGDAEEDEARFVLAPACSTGRSPGAPGPALAPAGEAAGRVVCCAQDGAGSSRSSGGLCLSTGASSPVTYWVAEGICSGAGLRLCDTRAELDGSCGPECGLDGALVWTSERHLDGWGGAFSLSLASAEAAHFRWPLACVLVALLACGCACGCGPCRRNSKPRDAEQGAFLARAEGNRAYAAGDLEAAGLRYAEALSLWEQALSEVPDDGKTLSIGTLVQYDARGCFGVVKSAFPVFDEYFLKDVGTDQAIWVGEPGGDLRRFTRRELKTTTQELLDLRFPILQNLAAVALKEERHSEAVQWAEAALSINGRAPKALLRKGAALLRLGQPGPASDVLSAAAAAAPGDAEVARLLRQAEAQRSPNWVCVTGCCGPWGIVCGGPAQIADVMPQVVAPSARRLEAEPAGASGPGEPGEPDASAAALRAAGCGSCDPVPSAPAPAVAAAAEPPAAPEPLAEEAEAAAAPAGSSARAPLAADGAKEGSEICGR
ncbi:unnamed protein product [Prorocentrum cordatum]|uniref:Uncharacterized protein n=1 Tax=Prorocentrum cordatum TaxID=2364126 RepID=A0ABN9T187_9DINO|nr:unnamed protein product [Polarella glacialis]